MTVDSTYETRHDTPPPPPLLLLLTLIEIIPDDVGISLS